MRLEWSLLGLESRRHARRLDQGGHALRRPDAGAHSKPRHPDQAPTLERPEASQRELKRCQVGFQPVCDRFHQLAVDAADEAHCQVEVGSGDPPEIWRYRLALDDVAAQRLAMFLGQR
jgi:hypothetical protein